MAHHDAREGKWRGKMRMEWVASSLALYVGTRSIQLLSADPHSSTAGSRLNWHPGRFKWTRPFGWKTKSDFCACAIMFWMCYTNMYLNWKFLVSLNKLMFGEIGLNLKWLQILSWGFFKCKYWFLNQIHDIGRISGTCMGGLMWSLMSKEVNWNRIHLPALW